MLTVPVFLRISSVVLYFSARILSFTAMRVSSRVRHIGLANLKNCGSSFSSWRAQKWCADIDTAAFNSMTDSISTWIALWTNQLSLPPAIFQRQQMECESAIATISEAGGIFSSIHDLYTFKSKDTRRRYFSPYRPTIFLWRIHSFTPRIFSLNGRFLQYFQPILNFPHGEVEKVWPSFSIFIPKIRALTTRDSVPLLSN